MNMSVYNIVWADDQIDEIVDRDFEKDLLSDKGLRIIGKAHNGMELEKILFAPQNKRMIDAIIVDANFNESDRPIESERSKSGLDYARSLYIHKLEKSIPMFLFTGRSDELLRDMYKDSPEFLEDFPRHIRWFNKFVDGDEDAMYDAIKKEVSKMQSTEFVIRNKYRDELNACVTLNGAYDIIYEVLERERENSLEDIVEPFVRVRRVLEDLFEKCETLNIIPPISGDMNGTAYYFLHHIYSEKVGDSYIKKYEKVDRTIMPMPLAQSLSYIVNIVQDGAHSKNQKLKLKVDKYFKSSKDILLLLSVTYVLMDIVKWYALTLIKIKLSNTEGIVFWKPIEY